LKLKDLQEKMPLEDLELRLSLLLKELPARLLLEDREYKLRSLLKAHWEDPELKLKYKHQDFVDFTIHTYDSWDFIFFIYFFLWMLNKNQ